jgi:hypothetical protein
MERGSDKHSPLRDEALEKELQGMLGQGGGHREDYLEPELVADDDEDEEDAEGGAPAATDA